MKNVWTALLLGIFLTATADAQLSPPCCLVGDVNVDLRVDDVDMSMITKHILGTVPLSDEQIYNADVNSDGTVSTRDLSKIQQYRLGLVETFPKCGDLDRDGLLEYSESDNGRDDWQILLDHVRGVTFITDSDVLDDADSSGNCSISTFDNIILTKHDDGIRPFFQGCLYDPTPCIY